MVMLMMGFGRSRLGVMGFEDVDGGSDRWC